MKKIYGGGLNKWFDIDIYCNYCNSGNHWDNCDIDGLEKQRRRRI